MKKICQSVAFSLLALFCANGHALAQLDAQPEPASLSADATAEQGEENPAIVVSVKGNVTYENGDGERLPVKVAQVLPEGAVVYTSLRSAVQIRIGQTQVFTIDRIGKVALAQMQSYASADRTTLDVDYGRVLFNVTSTEFANDVTIRAPDATLAIKGTNGGMEVTPGQPTRGFGGEFNQGRIELTFNQKQQTANINDDSEADAENPNPAEQKNKKRIVETSDQNSLEEEEQEANDRSSGSSDTSSRETIQVVQEEQGDQEVIINPSDPFNPENGIDFAPGLGPQPNPDDGDGDGGDMGGGDMMGGGDGPDMGGGDPDDMVDPDDMMMGGGMDGGGDMGGGDMGGGDMGGGDMMMDDEFITPDVFVASSSNGGQLLGVGDSTIDGELTFPVTTTSTLALPENVGSGGLTTRELSNGDVEILFLAGGTQAVGGIAGNDAAVNRLYSTIVTPGDAPETFQLLPFNIGFDFNDQRGFSIGSTTSPVLTDLVAFDDAAAGLNQELYAVRAFFDEGGMGSNMIESAVVRLDFGSTNATAVEVMNLLTPLEGLGGNNDRGLFAAGTLQSTGSAQTHDFADLVVYQIDPRNNYVIDSWWGGNNDFDFVQGVTALEAGFNPSVTNSFERIASVDVDGDGFTVVGFGSLDTAGTGQNPFLLSVNFDQQGQLSELGTTGEAGNVIGTANFTEGFGDSFAPQTLMPMGTIDLDIAGINQAFARVAYSSQALDSGAIETVFTQHFIETASDPVFCAIDSLISTIPSELLSNVNFEYGVGRTAYTLRSGLPDSHPCVAPFVQQQQQQGLGTVTQ